MAWPAIDGIDDATVRAVLKDDFQRFLQLCAVFMAQAVSTPDMVTATLDQGDAKTALRTLHNLRGAALSLGIRPLASAAAQLEDAIREGKPLRQAQQTYAGELARLQTLLAPWLDSAQ